MYCSRPYSPPWTRKGWDSSKPHKKVYGEASGLVARALTEAGPNQRIPIRMFNPGNVSVTVKVGAVVGLLHPADVVPSAAIGTACPPAVETLTMPEHLQELYAQSSV